MLTEYDGFSDTGPVAPQLVGDPHWTGVSPYAANKATAHPFKLIRQSLREPLYLSMRSSVTEGPLHSGIM